jgi:hypothetical protein
MILGEGARDKSPCPLSQTLSPNPIKVWWHRRPACAHVRQALPSVGRGTACRALGKSCIWINENLSFEKLNGLQEVLLPNH